MKVYKCVITEDEMTSDIYNIETVEGQPLLLKVTGRLTTKQGFTIDESFIGGNASAEATDMAAGNGGTVASEQVIDIVDGHRLVKVQPFQKTTFKDFRLEMKGFLRLVAEKLSDSDKLAEFKSGAAAALKYLYQNLKSYEVYLGESINPEGSTGFLNFEEDGVTPYMLFFKHGLVEEKY